MSAESLSSSATHVQETSSSLWGRVTDWVAENKAVAYTIAGTVVVITGAGAIYYFSDSKKPVVPSEKRKSKKERRKEKQKAEEEAKATIKLMDEEAAISKESTAQLVEDRIPEISEDSVSAFSDEERKSFAGRLKAEGNKAYGSKDYNKAIELYSKAIICKPDPVYYSNRAACYNALSNWEKVVEDTSAAISMDSQYVKALNRRAHAYEHLENFSEALLDYTASCIVDQFRNERNAESVERMLKKVAEEKAKVILEKKAKKLPSSTFVTNYLHSFRPQPAPAGLEESVDLPAYTGKGQLQRGLIALKHKTGAGYDDASKAFKKAIELNDLGEHEAFALNMCATFSYLEGDIEGALRDLNSAIEKQPSLTQAYIKRASLQLELGSKSEARADFALAMQQNKDDPDIYYHRAQLHLIVGEFAEAAKDYQKSIDLDRDFVYSHIQLGVTQYKMGSVASSMATFRRTIKNFDKVPDVYNYYGELLIDQQKYEDAIERLDKAMEMERAQNPTNMNVLPMINKALAMFQWKGDYAKAQELLEKALSIDPKCDIAVATMARLLLEQGEVTKALTYFERAAELSRTEGEVINALSYAEATRTQLEVAQKYPDLQQRLQAMGQAGLGA